MKSNSVFAAVVLCGGASGYNILPCTSSRSRQYGVFRDGSERRNARTVHCAKSNNQYTQEESNNAIDRRRLLRDMILAPIVCSSTAAHADDSSLLSAASTSRKSAAICDPTVESYRKGGSNQIHIVGTAHISDVSSRLSRAAVRETKVCVPFVILCSG